MTNSLTIEPTKFENTRTGEVTFGVRVYDDYESCYDNTWESIPDDDLAVFNQAMENDALSAIINGYFDSKDDDEEAVVFIGGSSYEKWELM